MRTALWMLLWLGVLTAAATVVPQVPNVPSTVGRWLSGEEGPGAGVSADCPVCSPDVCEKTSKALAPVRPARRGRSLPN